MGQFSKVLKKARTLEELVSALQIDVWDYILFGDGSGNLWPYPIGWCASLVHQSGWRRCFYGGASNGTNNVAEIMAYALPLWWLAEGNQPEWLPVDKGNKAPIRRVHIVSDSKYVVDGFNGKTSPKANQELWKALTDVSRKGIIIRAHWVPRATIRFNKFADQVAGECRLTMKDRKTSTSKGVEVLIQKYADAITPVAATSDCWGERKRSP